MTFAREFESHSLRQFYSERFSLLANSPLKSPICTAFPAFTSAPRSGDRSPKFSLLAGFSPNLPTSSN
jgi:hypothetical protein